MRCCPRGSAERGGQHVVAEDDRNHGPAQLVGDTPETVAQLFLVGVGHFYGRGILMAFLAGIAATFLAGTAAAFLAGRAAAFLAVGVPLFAGGEPSL